MLDFSTIDVSSTTMNAFTTLFDHWQAMRGENSIPLKSAINPMKIMSILPEIAIMERIDADTVIYRLAGTALAQRGGRDLTGINTLDTFPDGVRKIMNEGYAKSAAKPCAAYHKVNMSYARKTSYEIDCLYLPLSNDDGIAQFHIVLLFVADKQSYQMASLNKFIGYEVPALHYLDIGFGSLESDEAPSHVANLTKPK